MKPTIKVSLYRKKRGGLRETPSSCIVWRNHLSFKEFSIKSTEKGGSEGKDAFILVGFIRI